ncbi:hypothetical protein HWI79_245 [Cryptosporidium felis]|nr:hypothetical protein HWI79_245 [Cryptosporidium felis]
MECSISRFKFKIGLAVITYILYRISHSRNWFLKEQRPLYPHTLINVSLIKVCGYNIDSFESLTEVSPDYILTILRKYGTEGSIKHISSPRLQDAMGYIKEQVEGILLKLEEADLKYSNKRDKAKLKATSEKKYLGKTNKLKEMINEYFFFLQLLIKVIHRKYILHFKSVSKDIKQSDFYNSKNYTRRKLWFFRELVSYFDFCYGHFICNHHLTDKTPFCAYILEQTSFYRGKCEQLECRLFEMESSSGDQTSQALTSEEYEAID